jgi:hypothetical protein
VRCTPAAGVELVDELDGDLPGVERVVGHDQAETGQETGFAERPPVMPFETRGELVDGAEVGGGPTTHDRVRAGEGAEDGPHRGSGGTAARRQIWPPQAAGEPVAGEPVDERGVHVGHRRLIG